MNSAVLVADRIRMSHRGSLALAAAGAVLLSAKVVFVKLLYQHGLDAVDVITLRMLTAGPLFLAVAVWTWRQTPRLRAGDLLRVAGLGFMGYYASSMLDLIGLQYVSAGLERLILFLTPSFVLLLGILFLRRRVRPVQWLSLVVAYAGIALIFQHELSVIGHPNMVWGATLIGISAVMYAVYLLLSEGLMQRIGALRLVALALCVSTLLCLTQYPLLRPVGRLLELPAPVWWLALLNGTVCTALPIFMTMVAVRNIGAGHATQAGMVGPASTLLLAAWLLDEPITAIQLAGTALVTAGILMLSSAQAAPRPEPLAP
ncbi:DMT family transporter [Panacagrimonas sp.]|uniref:DMT family transporter n=1 Tax=Panacagrimonas sp. TaxID=2480088 RepID=UPI003B52B3E2